MGLKHDGSVSARGEHGEHTGFRLLVLDTPLEAILDRVLPEALTKEGFEVLSRVDLEHELHRKLGLDIRRHTIIAVCNPHMSGEGPLSAERLGLLLQCNIVVYESGRETVVGVVRPTAAVEAMNGEGLREIAEALEVRLERVLDEVARRSPRRPAVAGPPGMHRSDGGRS